MARNLDWQSDVTLFTHDVKVGPNSIMLNGNAGARYIQLADEAKDSLGKVANLDTAIKLLRKSIFLHKRSAYVSSYVNMGDAYYQLHMPDSAEVYWTMVKRAYPSYPDLANYFMLLAKQYVEEGMKYGNKRNFAGATSEIRKAIRITPNSSDLWYNLGVAYGNWGKFDSAYFAWTEALKINPNNAAAKNSLGTVKWTKKDN